MFSVVIFTLLLVTLMVLAVSFHLKLLFAYIMFFIYRKRIVLKYRNTFTLAMTIVFLLLFVYLFPDRKSSGSDYIQSVYYDSKTGQQLDMPLLPYISNIVSEGDLMTGATILNKIVHFKNLFRTRPAQDALDYTFNTPFFKNNFHLPYRDLAFKGAPAHNVPFQMLKGLGWYEDIEHYYLHIPEKWDKEKGEVIVFCHGFTGNWLLYTQLLAQNTSAAIIAIETPDFIGYFHPIVLKNVVNNILPHAYKRIGISNVKPHIIGLSNGGSAINYAVTLYPHTFKSYTILSASLNVVPKCNTRVNVIYGADDISGGVRKDIPDNKYIRKAFAGENHALIVSKTEEVYNLIERITKR